MDNALNQNSATEVPPSKRTSPLSVPIQRNPSVVCAMETGEASNTPSWNLHAVCAYCVNCWACEGEDASNTTASTKPVTRPVI